MGSEWTIRSYWFVKGDHEELPAIGHLSVNGLLGECVQLLDTLQWTNGL